MLHEKCCLSCFLNCREHKDASVNPRLCMQVKAGQNQADWEKSGWIAAQDPRGWFQWYCRFYMVSDAGFTQNPIQVPVVLQVLHGKPLCMVSRVGFALILLQWYYPSRVYQNPTAGSTWSQSMRPMSHSSSQYVPPIHNVSSYSIAIVATTCSPCASLILM